MKRRFLFPGSTGRRPVVRGSWPRPACATSRICVAGHFASGQMVQAGGLCSPNRSVRHNGTALIPGHFVSILVACFAHATSAVTLETVLQTTLEKNPAIQEAKSGVEQAAGQRLVLRSMTWPSVAAAVPAGVQGGHRAGENGIKGFAFARGFFTQTLFNAAIPPSLRRGDVGVLIAQQQLNVAVVDQIHRARLAFYTALYNRSLQSIREAQRRRLEENVATQKNRYEAGLTDRTALTSATVEARELVPEIESAHRAYLDAQLILAEAMASDPAKTALPEPEGDLKIAPVLLNIDSETTAALARRADLKLARLMVRAANEDQRIIEAGYYPAVTGSVTGDYIPITGIHREGSTSRTQDFISSEIIEKAGYTWRVIDNGKVRGAALNARATRETNELTYRKLEGNVGRELVQIANNLKAIEARERSLAAASAAAEESARVVQQNLANGLASLFEYRVTQNGFLETRTGLLDAIYQHNLAMAEWDRASGRYFQFSDDTAQNVH